MTTATEAFSNAPNGTLWTGKVSSGNEFVIRKEAKTPSGSQFRIINNTTGQYIASGATFDTAVAFYNNAGEKKLNKSNNANWSITGAAKPVTPPTKTTTKPATQITKTPADDDKQPSTPTKTTAPIAPTVETRKEASDHLVPGKRLFNPLGEFASYNYQISLYMITPDAYDAFITSGHRKINMFSDASPEQVDENGKRTAGGAFLIAQSGGINKDSELRAPGFTTDYGIDNLTINNVLNGKSSGSATNVTELTFTITEPYGFSFLTKLRRASDAIQKYVASSKQASAASAIGDSDGSPENPAKQFFIVGVRFYGYDISGRTITGAEQIGGSNLDANNPSTDPNSSQNSVFETFYDVMLTECKFKIDGSSVKYACKAATMPPLAAYGKKRGSIKNSTNATGKTVGDVLRNLMENITKEQQLNVDKDPPARKYANTYKIEFIGDADLIDKALIATPEDINKYKFPGSTAKSSRESNPKFELRSVPKKDERSTSIPAGTPILQAINQVISQSTFLRDALQLVYTTATSPDIDKKVRNANNPNSKAAMRWYTCNPVLSNARWDGIVADWAYDITYKVQILLTPIIDSVFANSGIGYYGPHKRYSYWYTGENSEIIGYEQTFNTAYYNIVLGGPPEISTQNGGNNPNNSPSVVGNNQVDPKANQASISRDPQGITPDQPKTGQLGSQATAAQSSIMTSLYSPDSWAQATINIMGDPDFLMQDHTDSDESQIYNRFYGNDNFTVNPNGGQVFIEVDFKEPIDYSAGTGLLSINESIQFWKYPESLSKIIKGVCYLVVSCKSTFSGGKFQQVLTCVIQTMGAADTTQGDSGRPAATSDAPSGSNPSNSGTAPSSGTRPDQPTDSVGPADRRKVRGGSHTGPPLTTEPTPLPPSQGEPMYDPQTGQLLGYSNSNGDVWDA